MKILYGIQGTGNGHTTRARALAPIFAAKGIEVDYLFSGRAADQLFDTEVFGNYRVLPGLTLVTVKGRINTVQTLKSMRLGHLMRDIRTLDVQPYDLVITDFEPISAWAARRQKVPSLGISHQYAFRHAVPQVRSLSAAALYRYFAPASVELGCHWHHFGQPVIPPVAPVEHLPVEVDQRLILVYLPFENLDDIIAQLTPVSDYRFMIYHPDAERESRGNIQLHPPGRAPFQRALASCSGVIANGGFGLSSEAIQLGKPLLVKPVAGQAEQASNGLALEALAIGQVTRRITTAIVQGWLSRRQGRTIHYPDVASALVDWIIHGDLNDRASLIESLWQHTRGLPTLPGISLPMTSAHGSSVQEPINIVTPGPGGKSNTTQAANSSDQLNSSQTL